MSHAQGLSCDLNSSPARKRARADGNEDESNGWIRHPELYMEDGTMILLADNTIFRVYPGLLSKHSEVFSGMSALSSHQPDDAESYDGLPLVRLTDNAEDLAYFLENMMGTNHFQANQPTPFPIAAGLLRLSSKYMVQPLRQQAIEHFSRPFPRTFDEIGTRESREAVFGANTPHPFALIHLFRECQVTHLLPWAFYLACREGFRTLVSGVTKDGTAVFLSQDETRIALLGWKSLQDAGCKGIASILPKHGEGCSHGRCNADLRAAWLETCLYTIQDHNRLDQWGPFMLLQKSGSVASVSPGDSGHVMPCSSCAALWVGLEQEQKRRLWDRLPGYFQLQSWQDLTPDL